MADASFGGSIDARSRRAFLLRRLHSATGVVPVGVFLVEHIWTNASALDGAEAFDRAVARIQRLPLLPVVELFGIVLPLAFHALYGVWLAAQGSANVQRYAFTRNWLYVAQRLSGMVVLFFVLGHLWELRVQKWLFGMGVQAFYPELARHLSFTWAGVPWIALAYLAGIGASTFHFANGLVTASMSWGITSSRAAQRRVGAAAGALGGLLFLLAAAVVVQLATGTRLLPGAEGGKSVPCGRGATQAPASAASADGDARALGRGRVAEPASSSTQPSQPSHPSR